MSLQELEEAQHSAQAAEQRAAAAEQAAEGLRAQLQSWTEQAAALVPASATQQHGAPSSNGATGDARPGPESRAKPEAVVIEMGVHPAYHSVLPRPQQLRRGIETEGACCCTSGALSHLLKVCCLHH